MLSGGSCGNTVVGARQLPGHLSNIPAPCSHYPLRRARALLGVSGPPLRSCPTVFSLVGTSSNSCALCCRTRSHAVCLGNVWGALLCAVTWKVPGHGWPLGLPGQEPGSAAAVSTALSHLGTGQEGSVLVVRQMGCSILECILGHVSPDLALHHCKKHRPWFALCFHSPCRAFSQRPTCVSCSLSSRYLWH